MNKYIIAGGNTDHEWNPGSPPVPPMLNCSPNVDRLYGLLPRP